MSSAASMSGLHDALSKETQPEPRSGDPSSVAGAASVLTSFLSLGKDLSAISPSQNGELLQSALKSAAGEATNKSFSPLDAKYHKRGTVDPSSDKYGSCSLLNGKHFFFEYICVGGNVREA